VKVFSFENSTKKRILVISNVIGCMNNKTPVHCVEVHVS